MTTSEAIRAANVTEPASLWPCVQAATIAVGKSDDRSRLLLRRVCELLTDAWEAATARRTDEAQKLLAAAQTLLSD